MDLRCEWSHGQFTVTPEAGMLLDATFLLAGRVFSPFARSNWRNEARAKNLSDHLRVLGAEFVGVPFGSSGPPSNMPPAWASVVGPMCNPQPHGHSANALWTVKSRSEDSVVLTLDFDESSALSCLERSISAIPGEPSLRFSLALHARRQTRVSVGLHPILKLPDISRSLEIAVEFAFGLTYPGSLPDGAMVTLPASRFGALASVPSVAGPIDLSRLPLGRSVDDNVQLCGVRSPVTVTYHDENARIVLDWDRDLLPSVMLWLSDKGALSAPFCGRYRGLGVEPIAAAFDLADGVSISANPINEEGIRTWIDVRPDQPVAVDYTIRAFSLS